RGEKTPIGGADSIRLAVNDFDLAALITAKVSVWGTPRRIAKPPIETVIETIRTVNVATMTDGGTHAATKTEFRFPLSRPAERSAGFLFHRRLAFASCRHIRRGSF